MRTIDGREMQKIQKEQENKEINRQTNKQTKTEKNKGRQKL